jgi:hypothetical protein
VISYRAYGLRCVSNLPIPGFWPEPSQSTSTDIVFSMTSEHPSWVSEARSLAAQILYAEAPRNAGGQSGCTVTSLGSKEFYELAYGDGTTFLVDSAGARLWATCPVPLTIDDVATYLRGPVMGFVLRRRGVTALHASALNICGRAIVLCGESESGKSTIAAALALRGTPVLCEDVTALRVIGDAFCVEPGYAQVGLWPDAVETLFGASDALPRLTPSWEKCFLPLDGERARFEPKERPLGVIYLLAPRTASDNAPRIEQISPREALLGLVQNTYMNWILDRKQRAAEFDFLSTLVKSISVRRIVPHSDPARIAALCDLIVADTENYQGPTSFVST